MSNAGLSTPVVDFIYVFFSVFLPRLNITIIVEFMILSICPLNRAVHCG